MRTKFAYAGPEGAPFEVPDRALGADLAPRESPERDLDRLVEDALAHPLDAPPLAHLVEGARRVLLVVDDATRRTPVARILPHLSREFARAGLPDERVSVLSALGTHRPMTAEELERKLGPRFVARWRIAQHDALDERGLRRFGETRGGMPVVANRLVAEADVVIGIGQVGVHGIVGYSGGAKILFPGVSGAETEACTHWRSTAHARADLLGVVDNPLRLEIEDAARLAELDAVLNVAMDAEGRVARVAYGDFVRAHRACAQVSRDLAAARLEAPAAVTIVEARPADRDYWQSVKGLFAAEVSTADGGLAILVAPNPEGVARNHPALPRLAAMPEEDLVDRVERGEEADVIAAAVALMTRRALARFRVVLVSSGIAPEEARALGFTPAASVADALGEALPSDPRSGAVAILRSAGALLPVVRGLNAHRHARAEAPRPPGFVP